MNFFTFSLLLIICNYCLTEQQTTDQVEQVQEMVNNKIIFTHLSEYLDDELDEKIEESNELLEKVNILNGKLNKPNLIESVGTINEEQPEKIFKDFNSLPDFDSKFFQLEQRTNTISKQLKDLGSSFLKNFEKEKKKGKVKGSTNGGATWNKKQENFEKQLDNELQSLSSLVASHEEQLKIATRRLEARLAVYKWLSVESSNLHSQSEHLKANNLLSNLKEHWNNERQNLNQILEKQLEDLGLDFEKTLESIKREQQEMVELTGHTSHATELFGNVLPQIEKRINLLNELLSDNLKSAKHLEHKMSSKSHELYGAIHDLETSAESIEKIINDHSAGFQTEINEISQVGIWESYNQNSHEDSHIDANDKYNALEMENKLLNTLFEISLLDLLDENDLIMDKIHQIFENKKHKYLVDLVKRDSEKIELQNKFIQRIEEQQDTFLKSNSLEKIKSFIKNEIQKRLNSNL
ncbi:hypothetical protein M0812_10867 [Anaeramoeba flamelloides]|uniref:Uncharacterized protein n=1 Tax=Anaeramoeba flamelloides TaxID=1746091 RepID=A0AAV7ZST2_9EUKA|nr:hypothetical protein M0812_10867 [Anaeramoeba flamelloides]